MKRLRYVEGTSREQLFMEAMCLDDLVSEQSLAVVIDEFVNSLDLAALDFTYTTPYVTGRPPYNPGDMLKLYIYGYLNRIRSSRRLETETTRNIELMWLLKCLTPDDRAICNFRKDNARPLKEAYRTFNKMCLHLGLIGGKTVAIDGSKFRANNSRKNHYTEDSAKKALARLDKKVDEYIAILNENDNSCSPAPDEQKITEIVDALRKRKAKMVDILQQIEDNGGEAVCTVDPEAKLMKQGNGNGFDACYNVQIAVDDEHGLVTAFEVTDHCNDSNLLYPMAIQAKEAASCGKDAEPTEAAEDTEDAEDAKPPTMDCLADKGYANGAQIANCEKENIRCLIPAVKPSHQPEDDNFHRSRFIYNEQTDSITCPQGNEMPYVRTRARDGFQVYANRKACMSCPEKSKCTKSKTLREVERSPYATALEQADARTKDFKEHYDKRKTLAEHPFGTVKAVYGYGQFLCRGKEKTSGEAALSFLSFNLRRVINILGIDKLVEGIRGFVNTQNLQAA